MPFAIRCSPFALSLLGLDQSAHEQFLHGDDDNTGGSIASTAVAITTGHSVSASVVVIILRMPTWMVCMSSRVVISSGQRY
jgi:hypothetical protein